MTSRQSLRIGLWGLGSHGRRNLLPAFERASGVELTAIHTRNAEVLAESAERLGVTAFSSPEELLASDDIDVVYLAIPTGHHFEQGERVLAAGKHLWCEKPLTVSLEQTRSLIERADAAGLTVQETDMFLHHPQVSRARGAAVEHGFDRLITVTARFGFPHLDPTNFRYSHDDGGGALLDAGFYPIAAAVAWLGAEVVLRASVLEADQERGVDTGGSALLSTEEGSAFLDWGFGRSYRNEIDLWFDGGIITIERAFSKPADLVTTIRVRTQSGDEEAIEVPGADQFAAMFEAFAGQVAGTRPPDRESVLARGRIIDEIRTTASVVPGH